MSITLLHFQAIGKRNGWTTHKLAFGHQFTLIHGPNGSGKTPLLRSIVYALGVPTQLPKEIEDHCVAVEIEIETGLGIFLLRREICGEFKIAVSDLRRSKILKFDDQDKFSTWLFEVLGIPRERLTTKMARGETAPYIGNVAPCFWVDQDSGWRDVYFAMHDQNFIMAQEQEIHRLILAVSPKYLFQSRKDYVEARAELDVMEESIGARRIALERYKRELGGLTGESQESLRAERTRIENSLAQAVEFLSGTREAHEELAVGLNENESKLLELTKSRSATEAHVRELQLVESEIGAEVEVLTSNALAADAFREYCGNSDCGLFKNSEASYGRRLLYLKDQLKDLVVALTSESGRLGQLSAQIASQGEVIAKLRGSLQKAQKLSGARARIEVIEGLSRSLADVETKINRLSSYQNEKEILSGLIDRREDQKNRIAELKPGSKRQGDDRFGWIRSRLAQRMSRWLEVLGTQNVDTKVEIDDSLTISFGGVEFGPGSAHSGSTRVRIVLAFRAALLETSLEDGGRHPGFLIFDTPKQHELASADLQRYFVHLRELLEKYDGRAQVVIAYTELEFKARSSDQVWRPPFGTGKASRYFGVQD
jgi:hypothetical protein